ncbi:unnamed protein product [Psylliodes chrysocephalus]|uniref:PH domain-containing protein n=1 Tax=Psylliodes chrysocephalus TaxID=3402493 RepID=A0A9P0CL38_9CUCU|nr:unnamed protein product [Psylliodes chrysocephala]
MGDSVNIKANSSQNEPAMKGWLFKWTNYLKGYQRRWFVLQNGHLSYYRAENNGGVTTLTMRRRRRFRQGNQAEMAHTCRGSISLHGALIYTVDACTFVISNGGTQTFHIKAASEVERQQWVTALELAKAKAIDSICAPQSLSANRIYVTRHHVCYNLPTTAKPYALLREDEEIDDSGDLEDWSGVVRKIESQLNDLQTCADVLAKHWKNLAKSLGEIETNPDPELLQGKNKEVCERATLFRIASNAMVNSCGDYLKSAQNHGHKLVRALQHEKEQRGRLQEMVETLAQQHSKLERAANAHSQIPAVNADNNEEDEFYDALPEGGGTPGQTTEDHFTLSTRAGHEHGHDHGHRQTSSGSSSETEEPQSTKHAVSITAKPTAKRSEARSGLSSGISSAGASTIAFGGSTIALPGTAIASKLYRSLGESPQETVRQRRTRIPDKPNYPLNLWSIMKNCIGKDLSRIPMPVNFNEPLSMLQRLTEDFEYSEILDIAAKKVKIGIQIKTNYRCTDPCEQLAYVAAFTISSYSTTSIRTGKPFNPLLGETYECDRTDDLGWRIINEQVSHHPPMVVPMGTAQVEFRNGNRYSWRKVCTTVHNIIVGKLWVDQHGDMEITGKKNATGIKCILKYIPYSYFTRDSQRRVKGVVVDVDSNVKFVVNGTWDDQVDIAPVTGSSDINSSIYETGQPIIAWKRRYPPPDAERFYNFTLLAAQLNEPEEGVAPTDSRLRPDQRLMEEGLWDESNKEKLRLEEKQRATRRRRQAAETDSASENGSLIEPHSPVWFEQVKDDEMDDVSHYVYNGKYWDAKAAQDWSMCPDIF